MSISCYRFYCQVIIIEEITDKSLIQFNFNSSRLINQEDEICIIS